tara:strand:+ start:99 stop:713 length:615 start_codon:yes stop_codon:yes gene_type:complete
MKLGVIDLNTGNLASLLSALNKLNIKYKICKKNYDFEEVDKIILPGVGAFKDFMKKINENKIDKIICEKLKKNTSILGVCVGFQVLFDRSYEHGNHPGLGILKGEFVNFKDKLNNIKVPHVGWNECKILNKNNLFYQIKDNSDFYFTHSYFLKGFDKNDIISETMYNFKFVSVINHKNIYGVQFHPEKSQSNGLKILKNFYERC